MRGLRNRMRTAAEAATAQVYAHAQERYEQAAARQWLVEQGRLPLGAPPDRWMERSGTTRDSQRTRLYAAENVMVSRVDGAGTLALDECEALMRRALSVAYGLRGAGVVLRVLDGRRRRSACGGGWTNGGVPHVRVRLPLWSRQPAVVLHECAHGVVQALAALRRAEYPAHGRLFCAVYLDLVRAGIGAAAADQLQASMVAGRVRFRPRRQVSAAQVQRLRDAAKARPAGLWKPCG